MPHLMTRKFQVDFINPFIPLRKKLRSLPDRSRPGLHLPILARELLDRGALLADGAWWIQEFFADRSRERLKDG